jgi:hypothetical protein
MINHQMKLIIFICPPWLARLYSGGAQSSSSSLWSELAPHPASDAKCGFKAAVKPQRRKKDAKAFVLLFVLLCG